MNHESCISIEKTLLTDGCLGKKAVYVLFIDFEINTTDLNLSTTTFIDVAYNISMWLGIKLVTLR